MRFRDWSAFLGLALLWGSSFLWIKIAVAEVSPVGLAAWRVLFGLIAGLVVLAVVRPAWKPSWRTVVQLATLGLINTAIPWVLIPWGEIYLDSAVASVS